jgi:hypothetical protein
MAMNNTRGWRLSKPPRDIQRADAITDFVVEFFIGIENWKTHKVSR